MYLRKAQNVLRALKQAWGTPAIKRRLWNKEYAAGRWNHCQDSSVEGVCRVIGRYSRGGSILDLGCGWGNIGDELSPESYREYTGVDISDVALKNARKRAAQNSRSNRNSYVQAEISSYVPVGKYDVILFRESIYYFPRVKIKGLLVRYSAYLKSDGVFIVEIGSYGSRRSAGIMDMIRENYTIIDAPDADVLVFR